MQATVNGRTIELIEGDITTQHVDAIVNAANLLLAGGGGVDGAIHRRGGPAIMAETDARYPDGCPTGSAVISAAGDLPAKYVLHAVGPVWQGGQQGEPELLASAHRRCLELAAAHECQSVAFPAISTGVYGYPIDLAARVALRTTIEFLGETALPARVLFVLFGEQALRVFESVLREEVGEA